jgi:hypothetical protein
MRVRHCSVRVIVRQPWLLEDPEALTVALTRLVTEVLVMRVSARLDQVSGPAQLGIVPLRVVLPASVVLGMAGEGPPGPEGRRMPSFGAEVAVHHAASAALRTAFEQVAFQRSEWQADPDNYSPTKSDRWQPTRAATKPDIAEAPAATPLQLDAAAVSLVSGDAERFVAAVSATLLAAARLGRLRHLLRRGDPALVAEWLRLLRPVAWRPVPPTVSKTAVLPARPGTGENGPSQGGPPFSGRRRTHASIPADESRLYGQDLIAGAGGIRPGTDTPKERSAGGLSTPGLPPGSADAVASQAGFDDRAAEGESPGLATSSLSQASTDAGQAGFDDRAPEGESPGLLAASLAPTAADMEAAAHAVLGTLDGTADPVSIRLEAVAAMAAGLHLPPSDPGLWRALEPLLAQMSVGLNAAREDERADSLVQPSVAWAPSSQPRPMPDRRAAVVRSELEVASVLPFLLVGPLDDLGVLDAITASVAGAGSPDLLRALAGGLARKALPPPADGWRQSIQVTATVAAFTGQGHIPDGSTLERLGRSMEQWWPVVEEVATAELIDLHAEGSPLVVTHSPRGLVVADADGFAPLLWDADQDGVRRLWERCGRPAVQADSLVIPLAAIGARSDSAQVETLAELVAMATERPASGRADLAPELDGPISFVANVALAALAWELWQPHGEATHPALAVRRLGDLDGRVSLEPDRVTVRLPLGRRHADLRDSGLLRTIADVPWLDGRSLEFEGG